MRRFLGPSLVIYVLCLVTAPAWAATSRHDIQLIPDRDAGTPSIRVTDMSDDVLTLEVEFPLLHHEDLVIDGVDYQRLAIPDCGFYGRDGEAGLPGLSRLVAIPDHVAARVRVVRAETKTFSGYNLLPLQPDDAENLVRDAEYYSRKGYGDIPVVTIGEPAIMRNLRVVPVTFNPVRYNPATGQVEVSYRQTVEITFGGADARNAAPRRRDAVTESFATMYRHAILNYDEIAATNGAKGAAQPGSFLYIHLDAAGIVESLEPLLDWRRRQGYNVVLVPTTETGYSHDSIRDYIQNAYETYPIPLEFVCIVGDATGICQVLTGTETLSGYGGEGDHYYTMLDGDDIIPDIHIGRLSIRTAAELNSVVTKIVNYEHNPLMDSDPDWFTRAALAGDPAMSGMSCVHVNQLVKHNLIKLGYTEIDTVWSSNGSLMRSNYNKGGTIATYRGFYGMSGIAPGDIFNLSNNEKFPFAVIITCETGSFRTQTTCLTEAFLRDSNGGAVACIGTSTGGTQTRENNCIFLGILDGVLNSGDWRVGPALSHGKIEMFNNYYTETAEIWCVWNNLMGDPGTEIWTARPEYFEVSHPTSLAVGAGGITVRVEDDGFQPLSGSKVALYKSGEILVTGYTDDLGEARLSLPSHTAGTLEVTVMRHNFVPYQGSVNLGSATAHVTHSSQLVDDDSSGQSSGNGDELINPGETIELSCQVTNLGSATALGVSGLLSCADPQVTVVQGSVSFGDIGPGAFVWGSGEYVFSLSSGAPAGAVLELILETSSGGQTWTSVMELTVAGAAGAAEEVFYATPGGDLDPGESGQVIVEIRNVGSENMVGADATLFSLSPWITVTDADGTFGPVTVGSTGQNGADPFSIDIGSSCFPGHLATFELVLDFFSGASDTVIFQTIVGTVADDYPLGPDSYGYCAFYSTDIDYINAPSYNWVEIHPSLGGSGSSIGLTDYGIGQDDTRTVDLPFDFPFYGESYDKISVCSNGWLAMGVTYVRLWYNKTLPCAGGPEAMIAPFWDDLYIGGGGGVFSWFDSAQHRFIIEWSGCRLETTNDLNTFQVILYDPVHYDAGTGDGIITCQYHTVHNADRFDGYATVGLQNQDRSDGLQYTYLGRYAGGAAQLADGLAISFQARGDEPLGVLEGDVSNLSGGGTPIDGASIWVVEAARTLFTETLGHFQGSVPAGTYTVIASHESFAPDTTYNVVIAPDQATVEDFVLIDILGPSIHNTTEYPHNSDTVGPYVITTNITDCSTVTESRFFYTSSSSGGPHELPLIVVHAPDGLYQVEIPGQVAGSLVQYWLTAGDNVGNQSTAPDGAPFSTFSFMVSYPVPIFSDNLESDLGWTAGDVDDDASSGLWERADPNAVWEGPDEVQPEDDSTPDPGSFCYITGNDPPGSPQGTDDIDGGTTTLLSPWFDLSSYGVVTAWYKRWYSNDTAVTPVDDVWVVEATNDGVTWETLEHTDVSDRSWLGMNFLLDDYIDLTSTVRLRFVASDLGLGSVIEAGVDDFLMTGFYIGGGDTESPAVDLISPDGGEIIDGGAGHFHTIEWDVTDNIGVVLTHILLSTDSGATWPDTLVSGSLDGSWEWNVPAVTASTCRIKIVCLDASHNPGEDISSSDFTINPVTAVDQLPLSRLALPQNRPNPFNPRTKIEFALPVGQHIELRIYDVEGRRVKTVARGYHPAGPHAVIWDGTDERGARTSSGVYFYRLTTPEKSLVRKMLLLK